MVGLIAKKIGSTVFFADNGVAEHITLLQVDDCAVIGHKTVERDGYNAVVVGAFSARNNVVAKPQLGMFAKNGVEPKKFIREFRVSQPDEYQVGTMLNPTILQVNQRINVVGTSKGKGYAGVMKKHGFRGLEASHGVSISHRSHGSIGQREDPGKVFKGKRMAGRMGGVRVTVKNLKVLYLDEKVIGVKGAVPGAIGKYVLVMMQQSTR